MNQYCRYCVNMIIGDACYCSAKEITFSEQYIKRRNHCEYFEFCQIDALGENKKGYTPREKREHHTDDRQVEIDFTGIEDAHNWTQVETQDITQDKSQDKSKDKSQDRM